MVEVSHQKLNTLATRTLLSFGFRGGVSSGKLSRILSSLFCLSLILAERNQLKCCRLIFFLLASGEQCGGKDHSNVPLKLVRES